MPILGRHRRDERERGQHVVAEPDVPEDRKPQSDEAHSAFTPPPGVGTPDAPEEDHPTSEFAVPAGLAPEVPAEPEGSAFAPPRTYSAKQSPPAFTPAHGVPVVRLTRDAPWQDRMRAMLRMPVGERPVPETVQRHEEEV